MIEKKNNQKAVETEVPASAVETAAATTTETVIEQPTETIIPLPVTPEVVAETPKTTVPVVQMVERKTSPDQRRYTLIKRPPLAPKGRQRFIVLHLLIEAQKNGKKDVSAEELVPAADALQYYAEAGTLASIRWHLHQMRLGGLVRLTNEVTMVPVTETKVTPAEVTPLTEEQIRAKIAELNAQLPQTTETK